ncbi:type II secretion system F family protein [Salinactinospora qingdaonensis]|uniref:Type II secretion system protein GspF domain-containing protein n=1 Tax=Salinactinospora qingdaonensis TaxID=702744 RepID=A0ABP7FA05_9ACTN
MSPPLPVTLLAAVPAALAGIGIAGGAAMVVVGCRPAPAPQPRVRQRGRRRPGLVQAGLAAAAGILAWLAIGWLGVAIVVPLVVAALALLFDGSATARERVAHLEATEEWVRFLADRLLAGMTLEQALTASADNAPAALAPQVRQLAARLLQGHRPPAALRSFAGEAAGFAGDQVSAHLLLAYRNRAPGAAHALGQLADWLAEDVANLRAIDAERARLRLTARALTLVAAVAFALLAAADGYVAPYSGPAGQVALATTLAAVAMALLWLRHVTTAPPEPRLLGPSAPSASARSPR